MCFNKLNGGKILKIFEGVRHERSFILLLSLPDPDVLKQAAFLEHENKTIKKSALEKLHRQEILLKNTALEIIEKYFLQTKK